ncbi:MAG: hypothetical protein AAF548_12945 [Actinomycetota bacterium]
MTDEAPADAGWVKHKQSSEWHRAAVRAVASATGHQASGMWRLLHAYVVLLDQVQRTGIDDTDAQVAVIAHYELGADGRPSAKVRKSLRELRLLLSSAGLMHRERRPTPHGHRGEFWTTVFHVGDLLGVVVPDGVQLDSGETRCRGAAGLGWVRDPVSGGSLNRSRGRATPNDSSHVAIHDGELAAREDELHRTGVLRNGLAMNVSEPGP